LKGPKLYLSIICFVDIDFNHIMDSEPAQQTEQKTEVPQHQAEPIAQNIETQPQKTEPAEQKAQPPQTNGSTQPKAEGP
jgi:hypothetical protein